MSEDDRPQVVFKFAQLTDGTVEVFIAGQVPSRLAIIFQELIYPQPAAGRSAP